jgi:hypothetical protein
MNRVDAVNEFRVNKKTLPLYATGLLSVISYLIIFLC